MSYRIKTVAEMTGIARNTLIAWERRHGLVVPVRAPNGYRVYSDEDVQRLYELKGLLDDGFKVSEAVRLIRERGGSSGPVTPGAETDAGRPVEEYLAEQILSSLLAFDQQAAARTAGRLGLVPYEDQLDRVWFPMLRTVGQGWAAGEISIIQEHFVTAFCAARLQSILLAVQGTVGGGRHVVCAGVSGERHELGLVGLAIRLSLRGWRVTFLGMDTPTADLAQFLAERRPELACLSVVTVRTPAQLEALAKELRAVVPASVRLVLGGRGVPGNMAASKLAEVAWHRRSEDLLASSWVSGPANS